MISLKDAILLLRAMLMVLGHFGITPNVNDKMLAQVAKRILPGIAASRPTQNAIFWLNLQCEDGVMRMASAWETVRRVLDTNTTLFWSMANDLCRDMQQSDWLSTARAAVEKISAGVKGGTKPQTAKEHKSGLTLPNSKL